ncbi:neuropeptides capa receptor-like [Choristoneura fumiferana]|uniref:neuropeptides capa receptor-like n=1 Tax=Choristoneura fumiferana TaxID=7141 RepID=UPI003D15E9A1
MCIIFTLSLIGNLLTCLVIYYDKSMHTTPNYYMFNLAISDFLVTLSIILQGVEQQIIIHENEYSNLVCVIQSFFLFSLWNSNMLMMTALAIERFVAVCHPFRLNSTRVGPKVVKKIIVMWLIAIAESALGMFSVGLIKTPKYVLCFVIPTPKARIVNGVLAIVTFVVPLTIMILAYSKIMFKVNTKQEENTWNNTFNYQVTKRKINKFMVGMMFIFVVCWMPSFVTRLLLSVLDVDQLLNLPQWFSIVFHICAVNTWVSALSNPIFFCLTSVNFRRALRSFWKVKIKTMCSMNTSTYIKNASKLDLKI